MIIFDLDGTLLNTSIDLHNALNFAMKQHNFAEVSLDKTLALLGYGIENLVAGAIPNGKENALFLDTLKTFKEYYTIHINDNTSPYEGIIPLLETLKQKKLKTGIVSNKFDKGAKILADKYFKNLIDYTQGSTSNIQKKPSPDAVFSVIKHLNAETETNIYVGDSEVDIKTAKNANIPCISVSWGFRTKQQLQSASATIIIDTPKELLSYI